VRTLTSEVREQQIEWRRSQVLELASQGYNQREICQKLQLDKSAVSRDMAHLKQQAQENLQKHIHEVVPEEYQKCMVGMKRNLKQTLEIAETASDPKTKLQARAIANDCYKFILDMTTNARVISDAMKFVTQKKEQLDTLQKIDETTEGEEAEERTTNGVF
jgi:predicted CopG family antitoxin